MSEEAKETSGQPQESASGEREEKSQETQQNNTKGQVAYETHSKLLGEKKKLQSEYQAMQEELERLRNEKLEAEGKKDELLSSYKEQNQKLQSELEKTKHEFVWNRVKGDLKQALTKAGCVDPEDAIRLADEKLLDAVEVGEDYSVDGQSAEMFVNQLKQNKPYLFSQKPAQAKTVTPGFSAEEGQLNKKDLSKMSAAQLQDLFRKTSLRQS